jgi:putative lipoprotein
VKLRGALALAPALGLLLGSGTAAASEADPWFGPDKALHFSFSVVLSAGAYAASSAFLDTRSERAIAGSTFSLTLGAGKELWDLSGHGDPSWRDFTWDVVGTAVGVALAVGIDTLTQSKHDSAALRAGAQGLVLHF